MPAIFVGKTNYDIAFYISDGFIVATAVLVLFLDVRLEKSGQKVWKSLKQIVSLPALLFLGLVFINGFLWGIHDTYLLIYLDETMEASSQLISTKLLSLFLILVVATTSHT